MTTLQAMTGQGLIQIAAVLYPSLTELVGDSDLLEINQNPHSIPGLLLLVTYYLTSM